MALSEMTQMQKEMYYACGHKVEIHLANGLKFLGKEESFIGKCVGFTKPLDNEPEVAAIQIKVSGHSSLYEITEEEIESIIILD